MSKPRYPAKLFARLKTTPSNTVPTAERQLTPKIKKNKWGPQLEAVAYFKERKTCNLQMRGRAPLGPSAARSPNPDRRRTAGSNRRTGRIPLATAPD